MIVPPPLWGPINIDRTGARWYSKTFDGFAEVVCAADANPDLNVVRCLVARKFFFGPRCKEIAGSQRPRCVIHFHGPLAGFCTLPTMWIFPTTPEFSRNCGAHKTLFNCRWLLSLKRNLTSERTKRKARKREKHAAPRCSGRSLGTPAPTPRTHGKIINTVKRHMNKCSSSCGSRGGPTPDCAKAFDFGSGSVWRT